MKIEQDFELKTTKLINEEGIVLYTWFWVSDGQQQSYMNAQQRYKEISDSREYYCEFEDLDNGC